MSCVLHLDIAWYFLLLLLFSPTVYKPHTYVTGRKLDFFELFSVVHWALCVYWTLPPPTPTPTPTRSIWFKGKSIALIHLGLPSYPSFLPSRIALFFNLQLTLPRSTCLSVLPSHSPHQPLHHWPSHSFPTSQLYLIHRWSKKKTYSD